MHRCTLGTQYCHFQVHLCNSVHELHIEVPAKYLTFDLAGHVRYNHLEWVQNRMVSKFLLWKFQLPFMTRFEFQELERLKSSARQISRALTDFDESVKCEKIQSIKSFNLYFSVTQNCQMILSIQDDLSQLKILNMKRLRYAYIHSGQ